MDCEVAQGFRPVLNPSAAPRRKPNPRDTAPRCHASSAAPRPFSFSALPLPVAAQTRAARPAASARPGVFWLSVRPSRQFHPVGRAGRAQLQPALGCWRSRLSSQPAASRRAFAPVVRSRDHRARSGQSAGIALWLRERVRGLPRRASRSETRRPPTTPRARDTKRRSGADSAALSRVAIVGP